MVSNTSFSSSSLSSSSSSSSSTIQRKSISNYTPPPNIIRPLTISSELLSTKQLSNNFNGLDTTQSNNNLLLSIESILNFLFPSNLQHPLAYSRLIILALYGPLNSSDNCLYGGYKKSHKLTENEIERMCLEIEREDILAIYTEKRVDVWNLSKIEQDLMMNQADTRFKIEKGKLLLKKITKEEVIELLNDLPQDEFGRINFHDFQYIVQEYRENRIKRNKLVFPNLGTTSVDNNNKKKKFTKSGNLLTSTSIPNSISTSTSSASSSFSPLNLTSASSTALAPLSSTQKVKKNIVNTSIAPSTMFMKNQGQSTADRIKETSELLNKHAYKIMTISSSSESEGRGDASTSNSSISSNVRLLREVSPFIPPPEIEELKNRPKFNNKVVLKGSGLGSLVQSASSTSYRPKYTLY